MKVVLVLEDDDVIQAGDEIRDVLKMSTFVSSDDTWYQKVEDRIPFYVGKKVSEFMEGRSRLHETEIIRRVDSIKMLIFCPECGAKHVDAPGPEGSGWTNPLHKSHLCRACKLVFRVADVEIEGVESIETTGARDTWPNDRLRIEASISFYGGGIAYAPELANIIGRLVEENDHVEVKGSAVLIPTKSWPLGKEKRLIL